MVYTKEEFKRLWEANDNGSGITFDNIADCAKALGISSSPRTRPIDEIRYQVLKAAQTNDAEEYNPNPTFADTYGELDCYDKMQIAKERIDSLYKQEL